MQILVGTLYLSLTYVNLIPASLAGLVVSRDLFLVYAGINSHSFPALEQAGHFYYVWYQCTSGSEFFSILDPGSRVKKIPDPDPHQRI